MKMETQPRNIKKIEDYSQLGNDDSLEEGSIRKIDFMNHIMVSNTDLEATFQEYTEEMQGRNIYFD